jgi:hypothetical protein
MAKSRTLKIVGWWSPVILVVLGLSYCSEWTKHRFEDRAAESTNSIPGARVIGSKKRLSVLSPVSWLWPATTEWTIALPDPRVADRFYTMAFAQADKQPTVFLVDADCQTRKLIFFGPDEPGSATPAQDLFGNPVVAANGKTYRLLRSNPDAPTSWVADFCDTDWSTQREAVIAAQRMTPLWPGR